MQFFCALMLTAVVAASVPASAGIAAAADAPVAEAYVAELDADWNVTRETRVACPAETGCAVDLVLDDPTLAAVHVRFDPLRSGAVAVKSRLEDRDGRASPPEDEVLALDRTGFAAGHYEARAAAPEADGRVIMMAVRVPGWTAPNRLGTSSDAGRT